MRWAVAVAAAAVAASTAARAQGFVSPGPLAASHAALDDPARCNDCHVSGTRAVDRARCLGCHEHQDLGARLAAGQGLHASSFVAGKPCDLCHKEHEGRGHDLMGWATIRGGERGLDHALTGWPLEGKHAAADCGACHQARNRQGLRTYLGTARPCEACHAKDHPHRDRFAAFGRPLPRCSTCHATTRWSPRGFDHGASTKFPLTGKHAVIACRRCHRGQGPADFEDLNGQVGCKECHEHRTVHADDTHPDGKYTTEQCRNCHPTGHAPLPGDRLLRIFHGPGSSFPLVKGHKDVPCEDCHQRRTPKGKTSFEPEAPECGARCHADSLHRGTLGARCTHCHVSGTWDAIKFDHGTAPFSDGTPGYPLRGEHRDLPCEACHGANRKFKDTPRACAAAGCHAADDAHKGRLGTACEKCHLETGDNLFNHDTMSVFRLDGKHLQVRCTDCHPSVTFKPRPQTCFGCHPEPGVHKGQYGTGCEQCHTTRTWDDTKPLHDVGDFSLRGQHGSIACERCHRDSRPLAGSGNLCINCHRQDDIHNNSLSPKCGECHTQWSFAPARFDHGRVGCNLTGLHRTLACFDCHKNGNFVGITAECTGCHMDDAVKQGTDGHEARRAGCTTGGACHNPNAWSPQISSNRESVCR